MATDRQPSEYHAPFTWQRLIAVAKILFNARLWVAKNATPERGDTRTGVGFRSWEHSKHAVTVAAVTEFAEWLSVQDKGARFVFLFGGMPIRFYRGESDEPVPDNYADPEPAELVQIELALASSSGIQFDGYYRIIVQADAAGFPKAVFLVGVAFADNAIKLAWQIPVDAEASGTTPIVVPQSPVPLPPLDVLTVAEATAKEREEQERAERAKADEQKKDNPNIQGA